MSAGINRISHENAEYPLIEEASYHIIAPYYDIQLDLPILSRKNFEWSAVSTASIMTSGYHTKRLTDEAESANGAFYPVQDPIDNKNYRSNFAFIVGLNLKIHESGNGIYFSPQIGAASMAYPDFEVDATKPYGVVNLNRSYSVLKSGLISRLEAGFFLKLNSTSNSDLL